MTADIFILQFIDSFSQNRIMPWLSRVWLLRTVDILGHGACVCLRDNCFPSRAAIWMLI